MVVAALPLLAYLLFIGCGSSSSSPSPSATQVATAAATQLATQAATVQPAGVPTYDIQLSGGLTADWKTGDGSNANCVPAQNGYVAVGVSGQIGGKPYALGYSQNQFAAGTYSYPNASISPSNEPPLIQVVTTTDSSVDWSAGPGGSRSGSAVVTGAVASPVTLTVDLDLTPGGGVAPVHVKGTLDCPAS
jgi:hypothetical protein